MSFQGSVATEKSVLLLYVITISVRNPAHGEIFVYFMSNGTGTTYTGITNDIERRVREHKLGEPPGFTSKYKINRLVHYEEFEYVNEAIAREKQIKKWGTAKKKALIMEANPNWEDLSAEWFE